MGKKKKKNIADVELEKIRTEYILFENEIQPESLDNAKELIKYFKTEVDSFKDQGRLDVVKNCAIHTLGEIENKVMAFLFAELEENLSYLDYDLGLAFNQIALCDNYSDYFSLMLVAVKEDNYIEISKLAQFLNSKFIQNYRHVESIRECIADRELGIITYPLGCEERASVDELFKEEFGNILNSKGKNKTKTK